MKAIPIVLAGLLVAVGSVGCARAAAPEAPGRVPAEQAATQSAVPTQPAGPDEPGSPSGWGPKASWVRPWQALAAPPEFVDEVTNPYWPLKPGTKWTYEAKTEDGIESIVVVVQAEPRTVMGARCTVVRDTVKLDGELVEDTYDWYAQDADGNVWYMGEDSKEYEDGKVVSTAGSWEAGVEGAEPGIKVWAVPQVGLPAYYQEFYTGEAEDLGKDLTEAGSASVPFGTFGGLLVVEEWTPLEPEVVERKYYKAGVGTVKEETVRGGEEVVELTLFKRP